MFRSRTFVCRAFCRVTPLRKVVLVVRVPLTEGDWFAVAVCEHWLEFRVTASFIDNIDELRVDFGTSTSSRASFRATALIQE